MCGISFCMLPLTWRYDTSKVTQISFQSKLFGHIDINLAVWQPPSPPNKWQVSPNKSGWCGGNPALMTAMYICHWGVDYQDGSCESYSVGQENTPVSVFHILILLFKMDFPLRPFPQTFPWKALRAVTSFYTKCKEGGGGTGQHWTWKAKPEIEIVWAQGEIGGRFWIRIFS